ncbi:MAG: hypothetical protein AB7F86_20190 [Bdellovibrionales bacterium]
MKAFGIAIGFVFIVGCASSAPQNSHESDSAPTQKSTENGGSVSKSRPAQATKAKSSKAHACKFDTDCMKVNTCQSGQCSLTNDKCRFRSDCRDPRGNCVENQCEYN